MLRINSVFILRKSVNYRVNLFSKRNVNSTSGSVCMAMPVLLQWVSHCQTCNIEVPATTRILFQALKQELYRVNGVCNC